MSKEPSTKKMDWELLSRVLTLAKPYRLMFFLAAALAVTLAPVSVLRPYLIQYTVDNHIMSFDYEGLITMLMVLIGVLLLQASMRYTFIYSTSLLGQNVIRDLRVKVFQHIVSLRLKHFDHTPVGQSTTRTINDIETINSIFSQGIITIIADIISLTVILGVMLYTSWSLTLVCLTTIPILLIATYIFKEKVKAAIQIVRTQVSVMNSFLQERITGMRIVQIFNAEEQELDRFKKINGKYNEANINTIMYYSIFFPVVEILSAASLGLMVWWGAGSVLSGQVSIGVMVSFPLYIGMLFRPIRMLADKFNTLQMGLVAADRVFGILDNKSLIESKGTIQAKNLDGNIEFKNVDFAYDNINLVLKNISFELEAGETLAIVGSTGSGKTTIINILNRFYETNGGNILIDDVDIKDYELFALRSRIAMVLQDVFLFSGTVLENITLRDSAVTKEEVISAAKMIGAHEFIEKLPGSYEYQVMERGATLSMGQRQLISFVRALVFDPDILILDEATSSIDPETESVIQYAIERLIEKRTSIIIAHRLSTIRHADKIMVLHKGEIQEMGSHENLLQKENGHYRELYDMQFAHIED
ncbi:MAG: ATP-binding cassette subfamily B multidrug efflux pump [Maribacter sp.]|jgi:ATP-binding cassette subfamily B multidrug efflux pump